MATDQNQCQVSENPLQLKYPSWLKPALFEKVIKESTGDFKRIANFNISPGVAAGENYQTLVLRADIEVELNNGELKNLSYFIKTLLPMEGPMVEMSKKTFIVEKEMYMNVLPEYEQMYHDVGINVKFGPKTYQLETDECHILMENLGMRGFGNANRTEGLDIEHTKCALKMLAQWHAASAVRIATKGHYSDVIEVGNFHEGARVIMEPMLQMMGPLFLMCMSTYSNSELYKDAIIKMQPKMMDVILRAASVNQNEFNVLNHGDYWCNNIMFQHDAFGKVKDTMVIDFQLPRYGTPAQDLYYFLLSSTRQEDKVQKFDYYIKYYHDVLVEHLRLLNYPKSIPTLKDIHISLLKTSSFGFMTVITTMSGALASPSEQAATETFFSDSVDALAFKKSLYSNENYRKHAEVVLPWLLFRGGFEV